MKTIKRIVSLVCVLMLTVTATACGNDKKTNEANKAASGAAASEEKADVGGKITMVLDWTPNTNLTGLYVAQEKGYFSDAGLEVDIVQPPDSGATDMVASGGAQFGIEFQDTMAAALGTDSPLPIVAVAAVLQHNTSGLVSLYEKDIDRPGKLEGHTYATWDSPIEQAILKNVVEADGGDFSKVKMISTYVEDIVAGLKNDIDCVWIYKGWDGVKLDMENIDNNFIEFSEVNPVFDYYSPVIISNT
nr:ABC transporter substrate-binding protein [Eubacterium sp.]